MSDYLGLKTNKISIYVKNNTNYIYGYKILIKQDLESTNLCGCEYKDDYYKYIRYSIDGKVLKLNKDMVIYNSSLKKNEDKYILLNIWLDEKTPSNYHYYGYFSVEKNQ